MKTTTPAFFTVALLLLFANMPDARAQISVSFELQPDVCQQCNGQASAIATGGVLPYSYVWSNGVTGSVNGSLCSGGYALSVTDAAGQTAIANCVIEDSNEIVFSLPEPEHVVFTCNTVCGTFAASIYAPAGYVTYEWGDDILYNTPEFIASFPGIYCVTVTDANGCTGSACTTLLEVGLNCNENNCDALCSSQLSVFVLGTPPYSYQWSTGATDTNLISGLCPGFYGVTVTDANGYSAMVSEEIHNSEYFPYLFMGNYAFCPSGEIYLPVNLQYESCIWNDGVNSCSRILTNTEHYTVTVTNASSCRFWAQITPYYIADYNLFISGSTALTEANPCTTIKGNYYYGNSTYIWSNGAATREIEVCSPGVYCVTATASGGCTDSECVTVTQITGVEDPGSHSGNAITVSADYENKAVRVYWQQQSAFSTAVFTLFDIWGRPVVSQTITANAVTPLVLPQPCAKGIYLWQLQPANGQFRAVGKVLLP